MVINKNGDILKKSKADYIIHNVCCTGNMEDTMYNKKIKEKFPNHYAKYLSICYKYNLNPNLDNYNNLTSDDLISSVLGSDSGIIAIFSKKNNTNDTKIDFEAFKIAFKQLIDEIGINYCLALNKDEYDDSDALELFISELDNDLKVELWKVGE